MATLQAINVGKTDNDQAGDPLRVAMQKVNANFADVQSGRYHQGANANALTGSNYPIANAGLLEVAASADGLFVYQEYTQYRSGAYSRRSSAPSWSRAWSAPCRKCTGVSRN